MKNLGWAALAAAAAVTVSASANAGALLDAIKARGNLICGVNTGLAGFSIADSQGNWTGIDVDYCKGVAAAVFGDASKVQYVPLSSQQRFTALQSGEVDILSRNTTWTLTRDGSLGGLFPATWVYDGQGFMVPKSLGVSSAKELNGATVCVQTGTTTELNLADYFRATGMTFQPVVFEGLQESITAFFSGRCDVYTTDASGLASIRSANAPKPDDFVILPELISKEPLGPMIRRGDEDFFVITRWVAFATFEAEELGVTKANVDEMLKSTNPSIQRLLGVSGELGSKTLKLDDKWAYNVIKSIGNYGDIWERNVTPIGLPRGANNLWTKGGLHYAAPVR